MTVNFPAYASFVAASTAARATFSTGVGARLATASIGNAFHIRDSGDIAIHSGIATPFA